MFSSTEFWHYPPSGPVPPSPVVVNTGLIDRLDDWPTTPPPGFGATFAGDDYAPCPATPHCVPSSPVQDAFDPRPTAPGPSVVDRLNDYPNSPPQDEGSHASDRILYDPDIYATSSPVMTMIERAHLDRNGLLNEPVNPAACHKPTKLFTLTGGHTPKTGYDSYDRQSADYYAERRLSSSGCKTRHCMTSSIEAVQHALRMEWSLVRPHPIPPLIIRENDIVGPFSLPQGLCGISIIVPTADPIWPTIYPRLIDLNHRPVHQPAVVNTDLYRLGAALYLPQHIVASNFALNVFLEWSDNPGFCDYMGAFVLQLIEDRTLRSIPWAHINPQIEQSMHDRLPPVEDPPRLQYVEFLYYKHDTHLIGLLDDIVECQMDIIESDSSDDMDSCVDSD